MRKDKPYRHYESGWSKKFRKFMNKVYDRHEAFCEETGAQSSIWRGSFIKEESNGVFINPMNKVMNWGRYDWDVFEDAFLNLKAPVVKPGVDPEFAMWLGADSIHALIAYSRKYFNLNTWGYLRTPRRVADTTEFGELLRKEKELTPRLIELVESHVKYEYYDIFRIRDYGKKYEFIYNQGRINPREELFSMFFTMAHMGFGYFGACNTPTERTNFSWWKGMLEYEALYEFERDNNLLREEWFESPIGKEY